MTANEAKEVSKVNQIKHFSQEDKTTIESIFSAILQAAVNADYEVSVKPFKKEIVDYVLKKGYQIDTHSNVFIISWV